MAPKLRRRAARQQCPERQRAEARRDLALLALFAYLGLSARQLTGLTTDDLKRVWDDPERAHHRSLLLRVRDKNGRPQLHPIAPSLHNYLGPLAGLAWTHQPRAHDGSPTTERPRPLVVALRGPTRGHALSQQGLRAALRHLAHQAGITKPVTPTALRHLKGRVKPPSYEWLRQMMANATSSPSGSKRTTT